MGIAFPSDKEITEMFGFVTPEDRERWGAGRASPDSKKSQGFMADMSRKLDAAGEQFGRDNQRAAAEQAAARTPKTRTTKITEHIREEEDLSGHEY